MKIQLSRLKNSLLIGCTLVCATVSAYGEFGKMTVPVNSSAIKPSCSYRVRGTISPTKEVSFALPYMAQDVAAKAITLEGPVSQSELAELTAPTATAFASAKPIPATTPSADPVISIRVKLASSGDAVSDIVLQGSSFRLKTNFTLEEECASVDAIRTSASDGCPMLAFRDTHNSCVCAYRPLTTDTICNAPGTYIPSNTGPGSPGYVSAPLKAPSWLLTATPGATKFIGPVSEGLYDKYVFDDASCSCKLCDPAKEKKSADNRSCLCRFSSKMEIYPNLVFAQTHYLQDNAIGIKNGSLIYPVGADLASCGNVDSIFDAAACACKFCGIGMKPDYNRSSCIPM